MGNMNTNKPSKPAAKKSAAKRTAAGGKLRNMKHHAAVAIAAKQPPLRVVHISNPMRVEVSPADFRELVQDLTGRHAADWPDHPSWNNPISDIALDNIGNDDRQVLLAPPPPGGTRHEVVDEEEEEGSLDDVVGVECGFGSDLSFYGDHHHQMLLNLDQEDFISSFYS